MRSFHNSGIISELASFRQQLWRCKSTSPSPLLSHRHVSLHRQYPPHRAMSHLCTQPYFDDLLPERRRRRQYSSKIDMVGSDSGGAIEGDNNYSPPDSIIESTSLAWITKVVIGYNLCPFAERPLRENKLKISIVRGNDDHTVAAAVSYELIARSDESQHGTTSVIVAPEYHPDDFHAYLSLIEFMEEGVMEEHNLHGTVQIAPFHPKFEFEGSGPNGIDNYTNRSPYPMFHILREEDVSNAVDKMGGDASKVWRRNIKLMQTMEERFGREGAVGAMKGCDMINGMDDLLKELKLCDYREG